MQDKVTSINTTNSLSNSNTNRTDTSQAIATSNLPDKVDYTESELAEIESGFNPLTATQQEKDIYNRQQVFLAAYESAGTIGKALKIAEDSGYKIGRRTQEQWYNHDRFGYRIRRQASEALFADKLEDKLFSLALEDLTISNSPLTLFSALGALKAERYRVNSGVQQDDTAKELIQDIRSFMRSASKPNTRIEYTEKIDKEKPD
jgi:hypothetical protein